MAKIMSFVEHGDPTELFSLEKELAVGSFGTVYRALNKDKKTVALKIIALEEDETFDDLAIEIDVLKKCNHPNIVKYYGSWLKGKELFIAMELCGGGSLLSVYDDFPKDHTPCNEDQIAFVLKETLKGLNYLHQMGIIHRDLKAANILLTEDGQVKLADFGVSAQLSNERPHRNTLIGTPYWMAPEVISMDANSPYDIRADIWSIGITAIELAEKNPPLVDLAPMRALCMIPFNPPPTFKEPHRWSPTFNDFINSCLIKDPQDRKTADELLQHPFILNCRTKNLEKLISDHREIERAQEEDVAALSQKWEQFLAASSSSSSLTTDNESTSSDEETTSASGTFKTKSPSVARLDHSRNSSASNIVVVTPVHDARATVKRTIIDPKTARPVTVKVDEAARIQEAERQDQRRLVKEQLKYIAKLQQKQQKTLESQVVKHKQELEQLQKTYQQKQKEKERQRLAFEQNLLKKHTSENESLSQEQNSQLKQLQKAISSEHKTRKGDFDDKLKSESKSYKTQQKDKIKLQKSQVKSNKALTSVQRKQSEREINDVSQIMDLLFIQNQQVQKLNFAQLLQMESLDRQMDLRRTHLDGILKQRLAQTKLGNQNQSDTLLLLQEIERELVHELQKEEHQQMQYRHQTQLDLQLELLRIQGEHQKKHLSSEIKARTKEFKNTLKNEQKEFLQREKELKKTMSGTMGKKDVEKMIKEQKEQHKNTLSQREKSFELQIMEYRRSEEEQLQKLKESVIDNLMQSHDRERRTLDSSHIDQDKTVQTQQHSHQVTLSRELSSKLFSIYKQQNKIELEFYFQWETQAIRLRESHQKDQMQMLHHHHDDQKSLYKNLKRDTMDLDRQQGQQRSELLESQRREIIDIQGLFVEKKERNVKVQEMREESIKREVEEDGEYLLVLLDQQKRSKQKILAEKQKQNSQTYLINQAVDREGQTKLHVAANEGAVNKILGLINEGIEINMQDKNGWTALHCAAYSKNKNVFQLLLEQTAINVSIKNESGSTPLHYFCKNFGPTVYDENKEGLVSIMIRKGIDVNSQNGNGESPLHYACLSGNISIVKLLLQSGAKVNIRTEKGDAPLHWAVMNGDTELVKRLIDNGADPAIKGRNGTVYDILAAMNIPNSTELVSIVTGGKGLAEVTPKTRTASVPPSPAYMNQTSTTKVLGGLAKLNTTKYTELLTSLENLPPPPADEDDEPPGTQYSEFVNFPSSIPLPPTFNNYEIEIPEFDPGSIPPPEEEPPNYE